MRFKTLKYSVAVALIIFIFISGNIIYFGKFTDTPIVVLKNNSDQNTSLIDPKIVVPPNDTITPNPTPQPVVVHTTTRTRAS